MATPHSPDDWREDSEENFDSMRYMPLDQVLRSQKNRGAFAEPAVLRSHTAEGLFPKPGASSCSSGAAEHGKDGTDSRSGKAAEESPPNGPQQNEAAGPRLDMAADPIALESQDVFSGAHDSNPDSTDEDVLKPFAASRLPWVPLDGPFTDDEITQELPKYFYFFLTAFNIIALKSVAKDFGLKQGYPKTILLARLFLTFMCGYRNGETELGLLLSEGNEAAYLWFKKHYAKDLITQEMPTVRYLNDAAHAERSSDAPRPHASMQSPPLRGLYRSMSASKQKGKENDGVINADAGGEANKDEKKDDAPNADSLFLRTLRPKRLFPTEATKTLEARRAESRVEIAKVPGKRISPPKKATAVTKGRNKTSATAATVAGNNSKDPQSGPTADAVADQNRNGGAKSFTMSEFARLILLLKDDECCRRAFKKSSQRMSRQELDRGEKSGDFWTTIVEPAFNDKTNTIRKDCSAILSGVDPSLPPMAHRTGDQLNTVFKSFRAKFMAYQLKYSASGQNARDFKSFVMDCGLDIRTALGKRIILGGFIMGLDNEQPDDEFLESVGRTIGRSGKDGYDARMSQEEEEESNAIQSKFISGTRKVKKDYMAGVIQQKQVKALDAITSYAEKFDKIHESRLAKSGDNRSEASPAPNRRNDPRSHGTPSRGGRPRDIGSILDQQSSLLDKIGSARKKLCHWAGDSEMEEGWKNYLGHATKHLGKVEKELALSSDEEDK